ncbi:MAG: hypothetical protein HY319_19345 [Armatimonadetes bacterium]|nr:hypothetical protein [Armatimonadota bacterium]
MPRIDITPGAGGDIPGVNIKGHHLGKKMQKAMPLIQQQNQAALEALRIKNAGGQPQEGAPVTNNYFFGAPPSSGGGAFSSLQPPSFGQGWPSFPGTGQGWPSFQPSSCCHGHGDWDLSLSMSSNSRQFLGL